MKTSHLRWTKKNIFYLVTSFMLILQYQNCAQPVNQAANTGDPSYNPQPIGGVNDSPVSAGSTSNSKILFAASSIELTPQSSVLRPGGICAQSDRINWSLGDSAVNSAILLQGAESCDRGTFHVDLSLIISHLDCEKVYSLSASANGSDASMNIVRHCGSVAQN